MATRINIDVSAEDSRAAQSELEHALERLGFVRQQADYQHRYYGLLDALTGLGMSEREILDKWQAVQFERLTQNG